MNFHKLVTASTVTILIALSNTSIALGATCYTGPTYDGMVLFGDYIICNADGTPYVATTSTDTGTGGTASADTTISKGLNNQNQNENNSRLVMSGTIAGDTLTVTTISSGKLKIGTIVSGKGIPNPVKIIGFGTGTGYAGTYKISFQQD